MSESSFEDNSLEGPFELIYMPPIILKIPVSSTHSNSNFNMVIYTFLIKVSGVKKCVQFILRENRKGTFIPFTSEYTDGIKMLISNPSVPIYTDKIIQIRNQLELKYGSYRLLKKYENYNSWNENGNEETEKPGISLFYLISNLDDMVKFVSGLRRKFSNTPNNVNRLSNRYVLYNNLLNTFLMRIPIGTFKLTNKGREFKEFINSPEIKNILQLFRRVSNRPTNIELIPDPEKTRNINSTISKKFFDDFLRMHIPI